MADLIDRLGKVYWDLKKTLGVRGLAVKTSTRQRVDAASVIEGIASGAPTVAHPNGSLSLNLVGPPAYMDAGVWSDIGTPFRTRWSYTDDLFGKGATEADSDVTWTLNSGSDAQAVDPAIDTAQAGGVWQLVTGNLDGTTAADASGMVWTGMPIQLDTTGGITVIEARVRIKSAITLLSVGFGLTDATGLEEPFTGATATITTTATDAVGFLFDDGLTVKTWHGAAVDTDTDDTGNATTGVAPVADTWQILRIEISADGATVNFFVNGGATLGTADLALAAAAGVGPDVVLYPYLIANGTATTSRTVDVDYVRVSSVR